MYMNAGSVYIGTNVNCQNLSDDDSLVRCCHSKCLSALAILVYLERVTYKFSLLFVKLRINVGVHVIVHRGSKKQKNRQPVSQHLVQHFIQCI